MEINTFIYENVEEKWQETFFKIAKIIEDSIGNQTEQSINRQFLQWSIPLTDYPDGYHCTPGQPLPYISIAAQKTHFAIYHMELYADPNFLSWFQKRYAELVSEKLNMGKSCIRFSNPKKVPFQMVEELMKKSSTQNWIELYEKNYKK